MPPLASPRYNVDCILTEQDGHLSRDNLILKMGQNLAANTVLQDDGTGLMVAKDAVLNSAGGALTAAAGILLYATDATAADTPVVALTRLAEVNGRALNLPTNNTAGTIWDAIIASLAVRQIVVRF